MEEGGGEGRGTSIGLEFEQNKQEEVRFLFDVVKPRAPSACAKWELEEWKGKKIHSFLVYLILLKESSSPFDVNWPVAPVASVWLVEKRSSFPQWVSSCLYDYNSVLHLLFHSISVSWRKDGTNWTNSVWLAFYCKGVSVYRQKNL